MRSVLLYSFTDTCSITKFFEKETLHILGTAESELQNRCADDLKRQASFTAQASL